MLCRDESRTPLSNMVNNGIKKPVKCDGYGVLLLEEKEDDESFL
jgi:hypothetical protein